MRSPRLLMTFSLVALGACSSKVSSTLDPDLQAKVEVVTKCIPPQMERLDALLEFSELWRQNDNTNNPPDPAELRWAYAGGQINYCIDLTDFQVAGQIQFFSPAGAQQTGLTLSTVSLSQALDDAATQLRTLFTSGRPFMVGEWSVWQGATCATNGTVSGGTLRSAGVTSNPASLTGLIAGSANQNELEEVRTTVGVAGVSGGAPAVQSCTITTVGTETCTFTFQMPSLLTDETPSQQYPIGTITWTLAQTGGQTIAGDLVFDGTVTARLNVTGVGSFAINLETQAVSSL